MRVVKRLLDVVLSLALLLFLLPLMLLVALMVCISLGSPIFFTQERPGLRGKSFKLYKFRSMTNTTDTQGELLPPDQRMTAFGNLLRTTSLDELPELLNVLRGEMSLVGPRPLLVKYLPLYTPDQARRHDMRPGITGWAQVNGRNAISWEDRLALDVWYVDNWSLWLDLKVLLLTLMTVLGRKGISHPDHATMPEFRGSEQGAACNDGNLSGIGLLKSRTPQAGNGK